MPFNPRNPNLGGRIVDVTVPSYLPKLIGAAVLLFILVLLAAASSYVIQPGTRGVKVRLGKASERFLPEGFGFRTPFITKIVPVIIKQRTVSLSAACFSSDLQQVNVDVRVLYRVPEDSVVEIYRKYAGDPFDSLIASCTRGAIKEVTALLTAEQIVTQRDSVKEQTIAAARQKIGQILSVEDIVVRNIGLSEQLEAAIEAKMVAEQEAARARFTQLQTEIEAKTAVIRAEGEAKAIVVRGEALRLNPAFLRLQIVEKWDGRSPLVVPATARDSAAGLLLPLSGAEKAATP